ncbi:MAG: hypothetical protein R2685_15825 [Candidatus Nitrosocosmicus sp.]|nr:hypothetical protein [Candidatus Nitrosocosmicus sp.]
MTKNAVVELWACNLAGVTEAGETYSKVFDADVKATSKKFRTGFIYYIKRDGHKATKTNEIYSMSDTKEHTLFNDWLLNSYIELVTNGDISPINGTANQLRYMQDLFDRSQGEIRYIEIYDKSTGNITRPGSTRSWARQWARFPINKNE